MAAFPIPIGQGSLVSDASSISPAWPTHEAGDIAILIVECADASPVLSVANGFVQIGATQVGGSSSGNATRAAVYWARASSAAMSAPTITCSDNHIMGRILTFRGCPEDVSPIDASAEDSTGSSSDSVITIPSVTTTVDRCLVLALVTTGFDSTNPFASNWASTDLFGLTELVDSGATTGHGGGIAAAYGYKMAAGLVDDIAGTMGSNFQNRFVIALMPDSGPSPDATAPTVTLISPDDSALNPTTPIVVDVEDETELGMAAVLAVFPGGITEVVHTGFQRGHNYLGETNAREVLDDGLRYRYTILRDGGWPAAPRIEFLVRDGGNAAVVVEP